VRPNRELASAKIDRSHFYGNFLVSKKENMVGKLTDGEGYVNFVLIVNYDGLD